MNKQMNQSPRGKLGKEKIRPGILGLITWKKKNFKCFPRKKNLCVESNRPLYSSITRERQNHRRSGRDSFKLKGSKVRVLRLAKPSCKFQRNNLGLRYCNSSFQVLARTKAKNPAGFGGERQMWNGRKVQSKINPKKC